MRCSNPSCNAELYPGDLFCGKCGRPASTPQPVAAAESNSELFPLYGVTLGETTVNQLTQWGKRTTSIDRKTGSPYKCYEINETNFWYDDDGIAEHMYIAKGIYAIPERWRALGFDWDISYNQWVSLLQRLGYSVRIEEPPRVVKYDGHDSFSAKISAVKQTRIPVEITLGFDYSEGTTSESKRTLYYIRATVLKNS
jgi:hypothetical protein